MKYIFTSLGGSGSSFFIRRLRKTGMTVAARPDTFWTPKEMSDGSTATGSKTYDFISAPSSAMRFAARAGFSYNFKDTVQNNLHAYIQ